MTGEAPAARGQVPLVLALLSGQQSEEGASLASLGPVVGLARLARGEIDRDAFTPQYGHRGAHETAVPMKWSCRSRGRPLRDA